MQVLLNVLLVVNVFVCIALVGVVLLQRSEGGALGMGGGGGPGGFMTARGAGDLLTRTTWILAAVFFLLSITQTVLSGRLHGAAGSIIDHINVNSLDLTTPQNAKSSTPPAPASAVVPAPIQAPTPQAQAPAAPAPNDPLSVFGGPATPSKPQQTPEKK